MDDSSQPHTPAQKERSFSKAYVLEDATQNADNLYEPTDTSAGTYQNSPVIAASNHEPVATYLSSQVDRTLHHELTVFLMRQLKFQAILLVVLLVSIIVNIILTAIVISKGSTSS